MKNFPAAFFERANVRIKLKDIKGAKKDLVKAIDLGYKEAIPELEKLS